jgi:hypothetical protein
VTDDQSPEKASTLLEGDFLTAAEKLSGLSDAEYAQLVEESLTAAAAAESLPDVPRVHQIRRTHNL